MPLIAAVPSSGVENSTKPKPRERPLTRSITTSAEVTLPNLPNSFLSVSSVVEYARFPTYSLICELLQIQTASPQALGRTLDARRSQTTLPANQLGARNAELNTVFSRAAFLDLAKGLARITSLPEPSHGSKQPLAGRPVFRTRAYLTGYFARFGRPRYDA